MQEWEAAVLAARSRMAEHIVVLDIAKVSSLTDQFILCTGRNARQTQAIADTIERSLKNEGWRPMGVEGYRNAQWILLDYGAFVVHVFSPAARKFYDLERLWRNAPRIEAPEAA